MCIHANLHKPSCDHVIPLHKILSEVSQNCQDLAFLYLIHCWRQPQFLFLSLSTSNPSQQLPWALHLDCPFFPFSLWIKPKSLYWLSGFHMIYCPADLIPYYSFPSSHCFSYTNFLFTLQAHQAAHSHLRAFALAFPGTQNIYPSQPNYLHGILHFLQISAQMSPLSEFFPYQSPHFIVIPSPLCYSVFFYSTYHYLSYIDWFVCLLSVSLNWNITLMRAGSLLRIVLRLDKYLLNE